MNKIINLWKDILYGRNMGPIILLGLIFIVAYIFSDKWWIDYSKKYIIGFSCAALFSKFCLRDFFKKMKGKKIEK